jgi:hypothetical protein
MSAVPTVAGKPWHHSKTLWFNAIALVLGMAEMQFKLLEQYIPAAVFPALAFVLAVANVLLRFITTTALVMPRVDQPAQPAPAAPPVPSAPPVQPSQGGFISLAWLPALKWLGAGALVAYAVISIYGAGADANESNWLKKQAAQQQADLAERDRLAVVARAAAEYAIEEDRRAAERKQYLTGVMNHARKQFPLVQSHSVERADSVRPVCDSDGAVAQIPEHEAAVGNQPLLQPYAASAPNADLTFGAVWLWNAALSGQAAAPAGACRVDATTGQANPACATRSGLTLDDAWDNHAANATACAQDRARHQRLIDFLNPIPPTSLSK